MIFDKPLITSLTLGAGRKPNGSEQPFVPPALTVFVGPNSAGKSLALRELHLQLTRWQPSFKGKIISDLRFESLTEEQVNYVIQRFGRESKPYENGVPGSVIYHQRSSFSAQSLDHLRKSFVNANEHPAIFKSFYGDNVTLFLEADKRAA